MASRLGFLVRDLVEQIKALSPDDPVIEVRLDPRTYAAVAADLKDHVGGDQMGRIIAEVGSLEGTEVYGVVFRSL